MSSKPIIEIPKDIVQRSNADYVTYEVSRDGKTRSKNVNAACYAGSMRELSVVEIWCHHDSEGKHILPGDLFLQWIDLLRENRLAPAECKATVDKEGNHLYVPRGYSKHLVYSALCGYRWSESIAPLAYTVIKLTEMLPKISFWQIMHYALGKYVSGTGHSWSYITVYGGYGQHMNLANSLAFPFFWNRMKRIRIENPTDAGKEHNAGYTCDSVLKLTNELGAAEKVTIEGKRPIVIHPFLVDSGEAVLDAKWTPLYAYAESISQAADVDIKKAGADLKVMYDAIVKDDAAEQAFREKTIKSLTGH